MLDPVPITSTPPLADFPAYPLGANWRMQFMDADGIPLNMGSFEIINFGAISYREIFQNAKTILATVVGSAALERTLGVDQNIVDLPINRADDAIIAINNALYFWEPRVEVVRILFESDVINGRLTCNVQLKVKNTIYGTDQPYRQSNFFPEPMKVQQGLPPMQEPVLIPGPKGDPGPRGSLWFAGSTDPDPLALPADVQPLDKYLNTVTGDVFEFVTSSAGASTLSIRKVTD
jgi:phage baseplate assembly protein W